MKFAKQEVLKHRSTALVIDQLVDMTAEAKDRFADLIISLSQLQLKGELNSLENEDIQLNLHVSGQVTVPSSRSLAPVVLPVDLTIFETYVSTLERLDDFDENEAVFLLENDVIDIDKIVLDNLVANLPTQVLTTEEAEGDQLPTGNGWQVVSQSDYEAQSENNQEEEAKALDPRFAKLDEFFEK